jgi:hypothetical protein
MAPCPDLAIRPYRDVLGDVGKTALHGMKAPHADYGTLRIPPVLSVIRSPCVVHVDGIDAPAEWKSAQYSEKLFKCQSAKSRCLRHIVSAIVNSLRFAPL